MRTIDIKYDFYIPQGLGFVGFLYVVEALSNYVNERNMKREIFNFCGASMK